MPYLIDSDWVIDHLADVATATGLLDALAPSGIAISVITYMEVYQGIRRSPVPDVADAKFQAFVDGVPVLLVSMEVARRCARLREELRLQGRRVRGRALDLLVAATALEHGLTLVTRNLDDYHDIPALHLK